MNKYGLWRFLGFISLLLLIFVVLFHYHGALGEQSVQAWIKTAGMWGPLLFIGLYSVATVCFLPGLALTLLGGFLFGAVYGTLYNMLGALLGAGAAFLIARYLAADWVKGHIGGKLSLLMTGIAKEGWRFVALVRLVPVLPFNVLNYALGLTPVSAPAYVVTSAICMLPACFVYTYLGSLGEVALHSEGVTLVSRVLLALGLLMLLACLPWFVRRYRAVKSKE